MSEHRFFWRDAVAVHATAEDKRAARNTWTGFGVGALAGAFVDTFAAAAGHDTYPIGITFGAAGGAFVPNAYSRARNFISERFSRND